MTIIENPHKRPNTREITTRLTADLGEWERGIRALRESFRGNLFANYMMGGSGTKWWHKQMAEEVARRAAEPPPPHPNCRPWTTTTQVVGTDGHETYQDGERIRGSHVVAVTVDDIDGSRGVLVQRPDKPPKSNGRWVDEAVKKVIAEARAEGCIPAEPEKTSKGRRPLPHRRR